MKQDTSDYGARRVRMVDEQLVRRGIRDENVLAAMRSVPRHLFVPTALAGEAYMDTPLPIGLGQTISQPYMVALMTQLLGVDVRSRVLEVGSGSGYQTAVLAEVAGEVFALERLAELAERARETLARLAYANAQTAIADGTRGRPDLAPFDAILVAAAAAEAPPLLLRQLGEGGRLVIPIGRPQTDQVLTVFERRGDSFAQRLHTRCRFVPLISDHDAGERRGGEVAPG
ncbi:MAG TPA: protein-L-isoaspartate(D-aspartate) O-methyltransferase, partial [Thermoleophilia bacterium]